MLERLLNTPEDTVLTIVRVVLGVVMFAHGAQKMLGWFGGYGFQGTIGFFHEQLKIPSVLAFLAIMAEFFWIDRPDSWIVHAHRGARYRHRHGCCHFHGASAGRLLLELVR